MIGNLKKDPDKLGETRAALEKNSPGQARAPCVDSQLPTLETSRLDCGAGHSPVLLLVGRSDLVLLRDDAGDIDDYIRHPWDYLEPSVDYRAGDDGDQQLSTSAILCPGLLSISIWSGPAGVRAEAIAILFDADPPAAIPVGFEPSLDKPMIAYAAARGYQRLDTVSFSDRYRTAPLYVRPAERTQR